MADEQFITTTQEVEIITETPAEAQLVETSVEKTYSFTASESSASVIETEAPAEVILETDEADPQIIQIETTGPQGAPGEKGEKGDKGDPGDPGLVAGSTEGDFLRYDIETQSWLPESAADTLAEFKADPEIAGAVSNTHASGSDNQDISGLMAKNANLSDVADAATARTNIGVPTLAEVKADSDITDALGKRHSNSLDHAQGTDQYLDYGGSNQVTASQVKTAVTNAHAPGSDNQDLSGYMTKGSNLSDLADAATARSNLGVAIGLDVQAYDPDLALNSEVNPAICGRDIGQRLNYGRNGSLPALRTTDFAALALGTSFDFSIVWEGSQDDWASGTVRHFLRKHDGSTGIMFGLYTDGTFFLTINGSTYYSTAAVSYGPDETHNCGVAIQRQNASAAGIVNFYADGRKLGDSVEIVAGTPATLTNTDNLYLSSSSADRYSGSTKGASLYNRFLSNAEMWAAHLNGVSGWDMWGSCVAKYTSDFSAGADSWNGTRCTRTGNVDGILGFNDCLSAYASADAGTSHYLGRSGTITPYKWYRITLDYYIPTGNTHVDGIRIANTAGNWEVTGEWTSVSKIFYYTNTSVVIYMLSNGTYSFTGSGSSSDDLIYLKNIVITELGAIAGYDSNGLQPDGTQWLDSTPNKCHLVQPTGTAAGFLQKYKCNFEIRWTCTWSGTHEAQYIGGFNQAVLPANCYVTDIIGVISGTVINDIIIGDGSDTDRWVAITSGLAVGIVSLTLANRVSDGTNYKMVVDPDANFTGSIAFTIRGIIMEA